MRPAIVSVLFGSLLCACPSDDGDGETGGDTHDHDHDHTETTAPTTSATTTAPGTESGSETATPESSGTTPAESSESGSADSGSSTDPATGSESSSGETGSAELAEAWCNCMVGTCHDVYHATFGDRHPTSEENCIAAGTAVPTNGSETMAGDFIECRIYWCEQAAEDEALCENAIGNAVCI